MPDSNEFEHMKRFAAEVGLPPATGLGFGAAIEGGGKPLITYWGPVHELLIENPDNGFTCRRVASLAARAGIGEDEWESRLINLNRQSDGDDLVRLRDRDWMEGWNGLWVHQSHGLQGKVSAGGLYTGGQFFDDFARHILLAPGFRAGLVKCCWAAAPSIYGGASVLQGLAECARAREGRGRLYGASAITWLPWEGPAQGRPCVSLEALLGHAGINNPEVAADPACRARMASQYHPDNDDFRSWQNDPIAGLDRLAAGVTGRFLDEAGFDAAHARSIVARPADAPEEEQAGGDEGPVAASRNDPHWYEVVIG